MVIIVFFRFKSLLSLLWLWYWCLVCPLVAWSNHMCKSSGAGSLLECEWILSRSMYLSRWANCLNLPFTKWNQNIVINLYQSYNSNQFKRSHYLGAAMISTKKPSSASTNRTPEWSSLLYVVMVLIFVTNQQTHWNPTFCFWSLYCWIFLSKICIYYWFWLYIITLIPFDSHLSYCALFFVKV